MKTIGALAALPLLTLAQSSYGSMPQPAGNGSSPDADGKYLVESEGIRAAFIPYGASISNLWIKDVTGVERDIVLGFDNASYYSIDKQHPHLGGVPGRYANRIKNSTFEIDGTTYHVSPNENGGADTLHGGLDGWDWRNWTVVAHTTDSITFSLVDPDGKEGFPGEVISYVTYTLTPNTWNIRMTALSTTKKTPIMLSSHTYWNLDGFQNPNTPLALNHTLHLPYGGLRPEVDNILIPTGNILANKPYSVNDFYTAPKQLGANFSSPDLKGNCGFNCTGYDTCYIFNREGKNPTGFNWEDKPVATLASPWSGIELNIYSEQDAFQVYTCNGQNGTLTLKKTQGLDTRPRVVEQYGCLVMEVEDWIDAINNPEWGRDSRQIFGPEDGPYSLTAKYEFSLAGKKNSTATAYPRR